MDTRISFTFNEASALSDALDIAIKTLSTAISGRPDVDSRIMRMKKMRDEISSVTAILYNSWKDQTAEYTETIKNLKRDAENIKSTADHLRRDINDQAKSGIRRGEVKQEPEIIALAETVAQLETEYPSLINEIHHIKGELASLKLYLTKQAKSKKVLKKKK